MCRCLSQLVTTSALRRCYLTKHCAVCARKACEFSLKTLTIWWLVNHHASWLAIIRCRPRTTSSATSHASRKCHCLKHADVVYDDAEHRAPQQQRILRHAERRRQFVSSNSPATWCGQLVHGCALLDITMPGNPACPAACHHCSDSNSSATANQEAAMPHE